MKMIWIILFLLGGSVALYVINYIVAAGINKGVSAADNVVRHVVDKAESKEPEKLADRFRKDEDDTHEKQ